MRKAITSLLVAIWLFGTAVFGTRLYLDITAPESLGFVYLDQVENYREKYKAWFQACDYTSYSCIGVTPPRVVTEWMRYSLLGYYDGSGSIYVSQRLKGRRLNEVLMHEMIHYLQTQVGGLQVPGYAKEICAAEEEAFGTVDAWMFDHSYADLMRGDKWWRPYSHCWEWYSPDYQEEPDGGGWWGYTVPL